MSRISGVAIRVGGTTAMVLALAAYGTGVAHAEAQGSASAVTQVAQASAGNGAAAGAPAAPPAADNGTLEEVTVTARYQTENLQQTPISITALTAEDLEKQGIENLTDIARDVPNLRLAENSGAFGNSASVFIRGIGQADFHPALDPGVGIYMDGVYLGELYGDELDLADVSRINVLRGPQGTLFGRNTEGGAIQIDTVQPKGDYSGYAEVGYGSYNHEQFKGAFDIPLIQDLLSARVSAGVNNMDGYVDTIDFACANPAATAALNKANPTLNLKPTTTAPGCKTGDLGGSDTQNYHLSLLYTPSADLKMLVTGGYLDLRGEEPASVTTYINPFYPGTVGSVIGSAVPAGYGPIFLSPGKYATYQGNSDNVNGIQFPNENNTFEYLFTDTIDYDTPWDVHVKNIFGYQHFEGDFSTYLGGSPIDIDSNLNTVTHRQISEEMDFTGSTDALFGRKLDWAVGAYYYNAQTNYNSPIVDLPPFGLAFEGDNNAFDTNTSGFVHGVYHLTDEFDIEAGVRYSTETKTFDFHEFNPCVPIHGGDCGGDTEAFAGVPPHTGPFISSSARFDPKIEFDYHILPDSMVYAQVATGYKGGGINPRPAAANEFTTFKPEDLTAYEVGTKNQFLDNKVRVNADIFAEDYKDLQTPLVPPGSAGSIYVNTGHEMIYGTEFEVDATPLPGLQINSSAGWLHNKVYAEGQAGACLTGSTPAALPVNPTLAQLEQATCQINGLLPGQKIPGVPSWKAQAGVQYSYDVGGYGTVTPRLDWSYTGTEYFGTQASFVQTQLPTGKIVQTSEPVIGRQPGYSTFDARLGFDSDDGNWTAAFQVFNLTNEYYFLNGFGLLSSYGNFDAVPALPRTYFFSIKRTFQPQAEAAAYTPPPPPPPAPAAPAPAPAPTMEKQREFQVFFDFDKSNITEAAAKVIQSAADVVKQGGIAHITVTGHTDTVGTSKYNQALSERRAASVKTQLVSDGVSGGEISTVGVGKTGLLVPTADGVREPQNRRAVIELQ